MIISIIIYFGSAVIASQLGDYFLHQKSSQKQKLGIFLVCFFLALIASFRGKAGTDSVNYIIMYNSPEYYFTRTDIEIGFKILMFLCHKITSDYMFLFGVMGFMTSLFVVLMIKEHMDIVSCKVSLFVFVLLFYFLTFNIMRQGLAVAMSLYAVTLYLKEKKWTALGILIIASTFHISVLMCMIFPVIYKISKSNFFKEAQVILILLSIYIVFHREIISNLLYVLSDIPKIGDILSTKYFHYISNVSENNVHALIVAIMRFLPIILICRIALKYISCDNRWRFYYIVMCIGYIISLLGVLTGTQAERLGYSFIHFNILLLGAVGNIKFRIGKYYVKQNIERKLIYIVTIVLFAYVRLYRNYAGLVPYGKGVF